MSRNYRILFFLLLMQMGPHGHATNLDMDWDPDDPESVAEHYAALPKLRLSLQGGYSQWTGGWDVENVSKSELRYMNGLNRGVSLAMEAGFFPLGRAGLGVTYVKAFHYQRETVLSDTGNNVYGPISDKIRFSYMGITAWSRMAISSRSTVYGGVGAGPIAFSDEAKNPMQTLHIETDTYAVLFEFAWDYVLFPLVSVGIDIRTLLASADQYTVNGIVVKMEEEPDPVTGIFYHFPLHRMDIGLGMRITF